MLLLLRWPYRCEAMYFLLYSPMRKDPHAMARLADFAMLVILFTGLCAITLVTSMLYHSLFRPLAELVPTVSQQLQRHFSPLTPPAPLPASPPSAAIATGTAIATTISRHTVTIMHPPQGRACSCPDTTGSGTVSSSSSAELAFEFRGEREEPACRIVLGDADTTRGT